MRPVRRCLFLALILLLVQALGHAQSPDNVRLSITKDIMDEIAHERIELVREQFSPDLKDSMTEEQMVVTLNQLVESAGTFQVQISQSRRTVQGTATYVSRSQFENFKVELKLVFNDSNQITNLRIGPVSDMSPESMEAAAKEIASLLQQESFSEISAKFTDQMRDTMPTDRLSVSWLHIKMFLGQFKGIRTARKDSDLDRVDVRCEFENGPMIVRVAFDPSGKVDGLWLMPAEKEKDSQI